MAYTLVGDVVVPEVFNPYVIERTAALSALYQSGIIGRDTTLDRLASTGGTIVNMPFWKDLTGNSEPLQSGGTLTVQNISTGQDQARLIARGKAWGAEDLAGALAGSDPMGAIGDLVGGWWARDMQTTLLSILTGVFGAASMSSNVLDISSESGDNAVLTASTFIDALQKLGDARNNIIAVMMHSAAVSHLAKLDLIDTIPESEGTPAVSRFLGKTVVEDDNCPVSAGVYTSYLFGPGAIGWGEGSAPVPTEVGRNGLASQDFLINRRHFLLHPRGVKWTEDTVANETPTNAELATAANWERVYEAKNVRIVKFTYRLVSVGS